MSHDCCAHGSGHDSHGHDHRADERRHGCCCCGCTCGCHTGRSHGDHDGHDHDHRGCDHGHGDHGHCDGDHGHGDGDHGHGDHGHGDDGTTVGWKNPKRPGHHCGTSTGQLPGGVVQPGNFDHHPPNQWPGPRDQMYLPFLFMRANPGDLGARPVVGPFWESPDILLLAGVEPAFAPEIPPDLGQTALAGMPNTLYAHVWNFGRAQAPNVIVQFFWCDPSLGIGPGSANLIGETIVSLGARDSGRSHRVVKCPTVWEPTFVNGGHECLVVRVWDETSDGLGTPPWDAALNRHVAQRNIHVIATGAGQGIRARGGLEAVAAAALVDAPLMLRVGPLYDEPATVAVERVVPVGMPWLQLRTGVRGQFPAGAPPTGDVLLTPPRDIGGGGVGVGGATTHQVTSDHQQVGLTTTDEPPPPGSAHVYRVTASQQGQIFGGYTVVVLG
ncbi:hypothetical protein [Phycicoccus sp. 3266]|uniref:hypothetical protein n=1 Tax=Phycicoccus sp. 3266 TaxID=2817751 RepID=UPI00285FB197|nr:hypothetical protein [Phycicoccus sp. 3266]MDR6861765.1 hypothetical protein [Phycicoccus sp. 3266]